MGKSFVALKRTVDYLAGLDTGTQVLLLILAIWMTWFFRDFFISLVPQMFLVAIKKKKLSEITLPGIAETIPPLTKWGIQNDRLVVVFPEIILVSVDETETFSRSLVAFVKAQRTNTNGIVLNLSKIRNVNDSFVRAFVQASTVIIRLGDCCISVIVPNQNVTQIGINDLKQQLTQLLDRNNTELFTIKTDQRS